MMVPQALPAPLWTKVSTPWAETRSSGGVLCAMYEHAAAQTAEWVTPIIHSELNQFMIMNRHFHLYVFLMIMNKNLGSVQMESLPTVTGCTKCTRNAECCPPDPSTRPKN